MPRNDEEEGEGLVDDELRSPPPVLLVPVAKGETFVTDVFNVKKGQLRKFYTIKLEIRNNI